MSADSLQKAHDCKQASLEQENRVAQVWNGQRTPQSGGGKWRKGDVITEHFLLECKTSLTPKPSYSIKKEILDKANNQRSEMNRRFYAQAFTFGDNKDFYILPENAVKWLLSFREELSELHRELESQLDVLYKEKQEAIGKSQWTLELQNQHKKVTSLLSDLKQQIEESL